MKPVTPGVVRQIRKLWAQGFTALQIAVLLKGRIKPATVYNYVGKKPKRED